MQRPYNTTAYRYPHERLILVLTIILVLLVIALTATATLCLSTVFVVAVALISYHGTRALHRSLMQRARPLSWTSAPELTALAHETAGKLQVGGVVFFVAGSPVLNAYTFGLSSPKVVVLHSALLQVMDRAELQFILGHELGHVRLGHTWLNTLVGGMAGIPSSSASAALLALAFRWWNRACEYSADRAGMLACGDPARAISALVKLAAGPLGPAPGEVERALARLESTGADFAGNLDELLSTHPMAVRRIAQLRRYAATAEYRRLQDLISQNTPANPASRDLS
jgi:Zn-dependent protease with chaperone function